MTIIGYSKTQTQEGRQSDIQSPGWKAFELAYNNGAMLSVGSRGLT